MAALHTVFIFSACLCAIAAVASFLRGRRKVAAVAGLARRASSPAPEPSAPAKDRTLHPIAD